MAHRRVMFHIGHSKTGSSFLQSILAKNAPRLRQNGIWYPRADDFEAAARGHITSGNGKRFIHHFERCGSLPDWPEDYHTLLFSGEHLFPFFCRPGTAEAVASAAGDLAVHILLFIRDPVAHFASTYNQMVKRSRAVRTIDYFAEPYDMPARVLALLRTLAALPGVTVTVRNFSRGSERVLPLMVDWLGLPPETLESHLCHPVNRSLTAGEILLQRVLNEELPAGAAELFADPVCNGLPQVAGALPLPSPVAQRAMLDRLAPAMAAVDAMIDPGEGYDADFVPDAGGGDRFPFTADQVRFIARLIARLEKERLAARAAQPATVEA